MVVFFDIDGTIIDDDTQIIPQSAKDAVSQLRKNGHIPVVNTGRPYSHVDPRIKAMDFAGFICACGMEILLEGQWLVRRRPKPEICRQIRQAVQDCNMQVLFEADDGMVRDGEYSSCAIACKEAYMGGEAWLDACKAYMRENLAYVRSFLQENLPQIKLVEPQGTYIIWLDCSELGMTREDLMNMLTYKARVWLTDGKGFGDNGDLFVRMILACPKATLVEAMDRLKKAILG